MEAVLQSLLGEVKEQRKENSLRWKHICERLDKVELTKAQKFGTNR